MIALVTDKGLAAVLEIIVDAVKEAEPHGMPGGMLYSALMAFGCSYSMYEDLMGVLIREGKLTKRGQLYFIASAATGAQA